jgi:hypothetical protein
MEIPSEARKGTCNDHPAMEQGQAARSALDYENSQHMIWTSRKRLAARKSGVGLAILREHTVVEQTNIAKAGWTNAKSNQAFFMGQDTVAEAIALPEEMNNSRLAA